MRLLFILFASATLCWADPLRTNVTLYWSVPVKDRTNATFIIRGTTNATAPLATWPVVATVPGVTNQPTATNVTITVEPLEFYYTCQHSNFWGVSDPSNVASTPAPPRSDISLGIR